MKKSVDYYLKKGFDQQMAEYFSNGRREILSVQALTDYRLLLQFDHDEYRVYDCKPLLKENTVFDVLFSTEAFERVYLDEQHAVCWDIDPNVDSNEVWNNKIDLSPDTCYVDSTPVNK